MSYALPLWARESDEAMPISAPRNTPIRANNTARALPAASHRCRDDQRGPAAPPAAGSVLVADLRPVDAIFETSAVSYRLAHVCGQKQTGRKGERASAR